MQVGTSFLSVSWRCLLAEVRIFQEKAIPQSTDSETTSYTIDQQILQFTIRLRDKVKLTSIMCVWVHASVCFCPCFCFIQKIHKLNSVCNMWLLVCVCVCMCMCVHVCVCVCLCVCVCVYTCVYVSLGKLQFALSTSMCVYVHVCVG